MVKTEEGIIFRNLKYGESSVILDLFTPTLGIKSFIVSGIRTRSGKNRSSMVQILNIVQFVYYQKAQRESLWRINEISFNHIYKNIPFDVLRSSVAVFLLEICRKSLRQSDDNKLLYEFLKSQLVQLDKDQVEIKHFHIRFLIQLSQLLGFGISNNYSSDACYFNLGDGSFHRFKGDERYFIDEEASLFMHYYLKNQPDIEIPKNYRKIILSCMVDYYRFHIHEFGQIKSLEVLYSLFGEK